MHGYITVQEAAEKWGVTMRQVQIWCKTGRIKGASMMSRIWVLPDDAEKPVDKRRKENRENDDSVTEKKEKTK